MTRQLAKFVEVGAFRLATAGVVVVAAVIAVIIAPAPDANAHGKCRGIAWHYTTADVHAKRISCRNARRVAAGYRNRMDDYCDRYGCPVYYVLRFRCVWRSHQYYLTVRCVRGQRIVRILWGD